MRAPVLALVLTLPGCSVTLEFDGLAGKENAAVGPGSVGTGIVPDWEKLPITEIVDGFVRGRELVVAVREHGNAKDGALLGIDLDTGARRLIAGKLADAAGQTWSVGGGSYLEDLHAVRELADGSFAALLWDGASLGGHVLPVDLESGDRGTARSLGAACDGLDLYASGVSPLLGPNGEIWLPYESTGADGVLRIDESACRTFELGLEDITALSDAGDALWVADSASATLGAIDHATDVVSALPGAGAPSTRALTVASDTIWTAGGSEEPEYARVALPSGQRSPLIVRGPAAIRPNRPPNLWLDGERMIVELDGKVCAIDPDTGESGVLSY
jgi:hypothetical protein